MAATAPDDLFDQFARGWRGYVLIALIALCSGCFGVTRVPPLDIDESRFAQATRQMVESGDYVRIKLQDRERNRKPVGIYWLQAASVQVFEPVTQRLNVIWPYRIPSVLGLILASIAILWAGNAMVGDRAGLIGAGLYASGLLAGVEGMTAKTDSMLVAVTTVAVAALARLRFSDARPRVHALLFWAALGCGIMIKGVIAPFVTVTTIAALVFWERKWDWLRPLAWWPGPLAALLITLPWLVAIGIATEGRFYADMFANELGPKLGGGDHAHGGYPGYYLALLPLLIFPATYALPAAARLAWGALRAPRSADDHAAVRFLLAWAAPTFIAFELSPTKLIHYTLPIYPALALMCAAGLMAMRERRWRTAHPLGAVLFGVAGALIVALMAFVTTFMPGDFDADLRRAIATALLGAAVVIGAIVALSVLQRPSARAGVLIACALVLSFSLRERLLPDARTLFVSNEAIAALTRTRLLPRPDEPFWVIGYTQPSFVFQTRTSVRLVSAEVAGARAEIGDSMMVEGRALESVATALATRQLRFTPAEPPARGIALGRGERTALFVGTVEALASSDASAGDRQ